MAMERGLLRMHTVVEVAVDSLNGARAAKENGAVRIELAQALHEAGGLTPSHALIESVVASGIETHVLIRPRPGGFHYGEEELSIMRADIIQALKLGAHGVVIGAADSTGTALNMDAIKELGNVARDNGAQAVTLHRVFDTITHPKHALLALSGAGITRVLTSGGKKTAAEAATELSELVMMADTFGIEIMAGGGITPENVENLHSTRVHAVHSSCSVLSQDTAPAGPGGGAPQWYCTSGEKVAQLVNIVKAWRR